MQLDMRLSDHPRARSQIRRTKGWAGLLAFLAVGLLSVRAGLPGVEVALRALGAGMAVYFIAWMAAVTIWRQLALAELEQARRRRETRIAAMAGDEGA